VPPEIALPLHKFFDAHTLGPQTFELGVTLPLVTFPAVVGLRSVCFAI
jgi:hypothetical protein